MKSTLLAILVLVAAGTFSFQKETDPPKQPRKAQKALESFCGFVPSGMSVVAGDSVSVQSFYASTAEVTNAEYAEFLNDLKRKGALDKLQIAQVDTMGWQEMLPSTPMQPYVMYYFQHPAYQNYPVVNVSKEGAALYCEWLTAKYDSLFGGSSGLEFRIPTHAEWIRAARGDAHSRAYSWAGPYLRNSKGNYMANHLAVGSANITRDSVTNELIVLPYAQTGALDLASEHADITAPAKSYYPNDFGLYNMNGNVAEMVSDGDFAVGGSWNSPGYDIRNESMAPFTGSNPLTGFRVVVTFAPVK